MEEAGDMGDKRSSDQDMISRLKEEGVAPKDINDALNRAKIKSAVSADIEGDKESMEPSIMRPEKPMPLPTEGGPLAEEDLTPPPPGPPMEREYIPKTREITEEAYVPQPQGEIYAPAPQEYSTGQEYFPQEAYEEYIPGGITDTDTMIEISEQVFSEKIKTIQKQVESMNEFKTLAETKIDHISARLKRIETVIDNLQASILEKVGAYGRGLETIKKEMSMVQDSFGKMIGGLAEKSHHPHHIPKKKTTVHKATRKISKRK